MDEIFMFEEKIIGKDDWQCKIKNFEKLLFRIIYYYNLMQSRRIQIAEFIRSWKERPLIVQ